jgi:DnaJ-class molecular chaperone
MAQSGEFGDEWEECDECGGDGIVYLFDSKPCDRCGAKIYFNQIGEKWVPIDAATDERHQCQVSHRSED